MKKIKRIMNNSCFRLTNYESKTENTDQRAAGLSNASSWSDILPPLGSSYWAEPKAVSGWLRSASGHVWQPRAASALLSAVCACQEKN